MKSILACFVVAAASSSLLAQPPHWPHWRGPLQNGVSQTAGLPTNWGADQNVAWRVELPGRAGATPVVWGDRIFLTTANGNSLDLMCLSLQGETLWKHSVTSGGNQSVRGDEGNWASPSPTVDEQRVVVLMGDGTLAAFDHQGNRLWVVDLEQAYGRLQIQFSLTSSPVLFDNRVYVQLVHGEGNADTQEARVACLDAADGSEVWVQRRVTGASAECEHSYASPLVYDFGDNRFLLTHGADFTIAHDLSTGAELWRLGGLNPQASYHPTLRFVASPGVADGLIVVPTAKNGPVFAVTPGGTGDIAGTQHVAWQLDRNTPDVPSPVIHAGLVYLVRETGQVLCIDAKTGEEYYNERTVGGQHRASPVVADGKLYVTSRSGVIKVIATGKEFKLLATNDLGEDQTASPVPLGDTLYLRTFDALWAIRNE
jgi:outer membrane protein assembly factor BamB